MRLRPLATYAALCTGAMLLSFAAWITIGGSSKPVGIEGTVDGRGSLEGAEVWAYGATDVGRPLPTGPPSARTEVQADGAFRFPDLPVDAPLWVAAIRDHDRSGTLSKGDDFAVTGRPVSLTDGSVGGLELHLRHYVAPESFRRNWEMSVSSSPWFRRAPGSTSNASVDESLPLSMDFGATHYTSRQVFDFAALPFSALLGLGFLALAGALAWHNRALPARGPASSAGTRYNFDSGHSDKPGFDPYLWLCLAVGLAMRAVGLGDESFELNEATYLLSALAPGGFVDVLFDSGGVGQWHSPLWRLILRYFVVPFGNTEWWLRAPSVITGVAAIWATYRLGIRLFGQGGATASALAVAASPVAVFYSQDVSPYALLCALGPLSLLALLRAWTSGRLRDFAFYGALLGIAPFVHYYGAHLVLSQVVLVTVLVADEWKTPGATERHRAAGACVAFTITAIFCVPVAILVKLGTGQALEASLAYQKSVGTYFEEPRFLADLFYLLRSGLGVTQAWGTALFTGLFAAGAWMTWKTARRSTWIFLALPVAYMAVAEVAMGFSLQRAVYEGHYVAIRYWIHFLPMLLLLAWGGIGTVAAAGRSTAPWGRPVLTAAIFLGILLGGTTAWNTWSQGTRHDKTDLRAAAEFVLDSLSVDDAIVVTPACFFAIPLEFYLSDKPVSNNQTVYQQAHWRTVDTPSGPTRVFATATDFQRRYRSIVENQFVDDAWVIDVRPILFGAPEFNFAPADSAIEDLLGAFETRVDTTFSGGVVVHHLSGRRQRAYPPDALEIGVEDEAFIRGFIPPPPQPANGRVIGRNAEIRFPALRPGHHRLTVESAGLVGATMDSVEVRINGVIAGQLATSTQWNRTNLDFQTTRSDQDVRIEFSAPDAGRGMPVGVILHGISVEGEWLDTTTGHAPSMSRETRALSPNLLVRCVAALLERSTEASPGFALDISPAEWDAITLESSFEGPHFRSVWQRLNQGLVEAGLDPLPAPMDDGMGNLVRPSPLQTLDELNWGEARGAGSH